MAKAKKGLDRARLRAAVQRLGGESKAAELLGVSRRTLGSWKTASETSRRNMNHEHVAKLAELAGVSPGHFYGEESRLTPDEVRGVADDVAVGVCGDPAAAGMLSAVIQQRMNEATTRQEQDKAGADVLAKLAEATP